MKSCPAQPSPSEGERLRLAGGSAGEGLVPAGLPGPGWGLLGSTCRKGHRQAGAGRAGSCRIHLLCCRLSPAQGCGSGHPPRCPQATPAPQAPSGPSARAGSPQSCPQLFPHLLRDAMAQITPPSPAGAPGVPMGVGLGLCSIPTSRQPGSAGLAATLSPFPKRAPGKGIAAPWARVCLLQGNPAASFSLGATAAPGIPHAGARGIAAAAGRASACSCRAELWGWQTLGWGNAGENPGDLARKERATRLVFAGNLEKRSPQPELSSPPIHFQPGLCRCHQQNRALTRTHSHRGCPQTRRLRPELRKTLSAPRCGEAAAPAHVCGIAASLALPTVTCEPLTTFDAPTPKNTAGGHVGAPPLLFFQLQGQGDPAPAVPGAGRAFCQRRSRCRCQP